MEFLVIIGIVLVVVFVISIAKAGSDEKKKSTFEQELASAYPEAKIFVSVYDFSYVAIDFSSDRLMVGLKQQRGGFADTEMPYDGTYSFAEIAEVALIKDGTTVTSTNRGSQAVGAAVGAVAFGGLGALIGGLSGSSTEQDRVRRITLRIKVDDPDHPVHDITVFYWEASKKGVKTDGMLLSPVLKKAEELGTHVSNAIRRSAKKAETASVASTLEHSTTLQISELWRLKEAGALTEQEFLNEKAKILGMHGSERISG
ncbi:hypothetical protein KUW09_04790 [Mameliella alba]|nr:hypothetical protein [Antarctobacter heliothermus]MBY6143345.1 hypothetical protein [Mameliella alba]MBY6163982.1 hypothetical protein [Mameliella alba]MBY6172454.1 hypothetical protein [Mameliella alba]MBY6177468.1 hypothetical protein [Mameliella alba]